MKPNRSLNPCLCACALGALLWPQSAEAYLGSFEEEDGYRIPMNGQISSSFLPGDAQFYLNNTPASGYTNVVPVGAYPNTLGDGTHGPDLSRYNAGQYGTSNGGPGGTAVDIADNSGLWRALAGGRLSEDADAPYYYGGDLYRDQVVVYRRTSFAHTGVQSLSLFAAETSLSYSYSLDSRDFGGINPASTAASLIQMSFWVQPTDWDDEASGGNMMGLSLRDAANQSMFEVGYTADNHLQYRLAGGGAWVTTGEVLGSQGWSELTVMLNTAADTASLAVRAYNDTLHSLGISEVILDCQSLGPDAGALTDLQFDLRGGSLDNGAVSFIHYFDDFSFSAASATPVPEPGGAMLVMVAAFGTLGRRRRRANA
ncbi:MAG: hypothetical protein JWR15_1251 [Prosthecobacter sp.]|nr:hypothetical protein [Prosthecobacter sp.]